MRSACGVGRSEAAREAVHGEEWPGVTNLLMKLLCLVHQEFYPFTTFENLRCLLSHGDCPSAGK